MRLKSEVGLEEVEAAHYLFEISTIKTIEGSHELGYNLSEGAADEIQKAEDFIRKRVHIGNQVNSVSLMTDVESRFSNKIAAQAIHNMIRNSELKEVKMRKMLVR